jgi:hypothetical protein
MQSAPAKKLQGEGFSSIARVIAAGGVWHMWRGLVPTLWRDVPFSAFYWVGVERLRSHFGGKDRSLHTFRVHFLSAAISGSIASALTHPFDVVKTRRQRTLVSSSSSFIKCASKHERDGKVPHFFFNYFFQVTYCAPKDLQVSGRALSLASLEWPPQVRLCFQLTNTFGSTRESTDKPTKKKKKIFLEPERTKRVYNLTLSHT